MPVPDFEMLYARAVNMMDLADLTPAERSEVMNIAQGIARKDSAAAEGVSAETIRACRKRIYQKLGAAHAGTLISTLEMVAGATPGSRGLGARWPRN